jgi:hypothetical protein
MIKKLKLYIEAFFPYVVVFMAALYRPYDTDLGWHLRYGEYFFKYHNLLRDNIFSTMMSNFKWANTDWGTDLVTYFFYHHLGFLGLTLLGAIVVTLTYLFFSKAFNLSYWQKALIFPILLFIEDPNMQVSFRGQLLSVLLLGILFYLIEKYEATKSKAIYLVIPLFLFWVNLNGQFILGLGIFFIWIIFYLFNLYVNNKSLFLISEVKQLVLVFVLSIAATFIDPFGFGIYKDVFLHFGNAYLKDVAEYLPFTERTPAWWNQLIMGILIAFGFIFLYFSTGIKKRFPFLGLVSILYAMSWFVRRYAWSFYYLTIPFLKPVADFFKPSSKKYNFIGSTILFLIYFVIIIYIKWPFQQYSNMNWTTYCTQFNGCSNNAMNFIIRNHLNNKNLLTVYDWGGWIIWNYPQVKPTIDGRMHIWTDDKGYSAFADYIGYEQSRKDLDTLKYTTVLMTPNKTMYSTLITQVNEGKWKLVYQDPYSGIFIKNVLVRNN